MKPEKQDLNVGDVFVLESDSKVYQVYKRVEGKGLIVQNPFNPSEKSFVDFGVGALLIEEVAKFFSDKEVVES